MVEVKFLVVAKNWRLTEVGHLMTAAVAVVMLVEGTVDLREVLMVPMGVLILQVVVVEVTMVWLEEERTEVAESWQLSLWFRADWHWAEKMVKMEQVLEEEEGLRRVVVLLWES